MKFVNPIGRTPGSGVQPRACMCTDGYAGYRGNDDGCVHCGCGCGGEGEYRTGNRVNAVATFRSSTSLRGSKNEGVVLYVLRLHYIGEKSC